MDCACTDIENEILSRLTGGHVAVNETKLGDECQYGVVSLLLSLDCAFTDIENEILSRLTGGHVAVNETKLGDECQYGVVSLLLS